MSHNEPHNADEHVNPDKAAATEDELQGEQLLCAG